jgi:hypothetical protein
MWSARTDSGGAWVQHRASESGFSGSGLFSAPVQRAEAQRLVRLADQVVGVENTRAASLSWPEDVRRRFTEEMREQLGSRSEVQLTQRTRLTMAHTTAAG